MQFDQSKFQSIMNGSAIELPSIENAITVKSQQVKLGLCSMEHTSESAVI